MEHSKKDWKMENKVGEKLKIKIGKRWKTWWSTQGTRKVVAAYCILHQLGSAAIFCIIQHSYRHCLLHSDCSISKKTTTYLQHIAPLWTECNLLHTTAYHAMLQCTYNILHHLGQSALAKLVVAGVPTDATAPPTSWQPEREGDKMRKADDEKSFNLKEDYTFNAKKCLNGWAKLSALYVAILLASMWSHSPLLQQPVVQFSLNMGHSSVTTVSQDLHYIINGKQLTQQTNNWQSKLMSQDILV